MTIIRASTIASGGTGSAGGTASIAAPDSTQHGFVFIPNWFRPAGTGSAGNNTGPTAFPVDASGRFATEQAIAARNTFLKGLAQQMRQFRDQTGQQEHLLNVQHPLDQAQLGGQEAATGTLFSTGNLGQQHLLDQSYTQALGTLQKNLGDQELAAQSARNAYNQGFGVDLNTIRAAAASRLAANKAAIGLTKGQMLSPKQLYGLLNGQ
jgi:hypothetical protein